jgi:hypothetical protein
MRIVLLLLMAGAIGLGVYLWISRPTPPPPVPATEVAPQRWRLGNATTMPLDPSANRTEAKDAPNATAATEEKAANATASHLPAEDAIIPQAMARLLAQRMADAYHPGRSLRNLGAKGRLDIRLQSLGGRLADLPEARIERRDIAAARKHVIAHALRPEVLATLSQYLPVFAQAFDNALAQSERVFLGDGAERRQTLTPEHRAEARVLLAAWMQRLSAALRSLATDRSHLELISRWHAQQQAVTQAQIRVWNVQVEGNLTALAPATQAVDTAMRQEAAARRAVVHNVARLGLGDEDALYLASWTARRHTDGMDLSHLTTLADALETAAQALTTLPPNTP